MHVAYFVNSFPKVSETFIMNQIEAMITSGHEVTVFAAKDPGEGTVHKKVEDYDMVQRCIYTNPPETHLHGAIRTLRALGRHPTAAREIVRAATGERRARRLSNVESFLSQDLQQFDAYHAHFGPVGEDWSFLHRLKNVDVGGENPYVVSFYGYDASNVLKEQKDPYSGVFRYSDAITVLSEDMEQNLVDAGCQRSKIEYNPLGIDTSFFEYRERVQEGGNTEILIVSRLVEKKGIEYAIDALAELDDQDVSLTIVGDGPQRGAIEERIEEQNLESQVELVGVKPLEEVKEYLYNSHIFLLPCVTDSDGGTSPTPTILLQAQATGIPVISTYHSGIPRIVEDGKSAVLVPERDVDATAAALRELVTHPERWREMGRNGRAFVEENHSMEALADRLGELYR